MSYTINKTDGSIFATVENGSINKDSSQVIVGKNYAGYGEFLGENFIQLLENAANKTSPGNPLTGQLWYDTQTDILKVFNGQTFKELSALSSGTSQPTNSQIGDLWFDITNNQLFAYTGSEFILIGPTFTGGAGVSGALVDIINDDNQVPHTVIRLTIDDETVGIISKDATFKPAIAEPGFTTDIGPGIQLSTTIKPGQTLPPLFEGIARKALNLIDANGNDVSFDNFMRTDIDTGTSGELSVTNDLLGLTIGSTTNIRINNDTTDTFITSEKLGSNLTLRVNTLGSPKNVITLNSNTGRASISEKPVDAFDIVNKQYADGLASGGDTKVDRSGDTMTGLLLLSGNPSEPLGAVTKQYADALGGGTDPGTSYVLKSGDTMTGRLTLSSNPTSSYHAATKTYVDGKIPIISGKVNRSGDTMTGDLTLYRDPLSTYHAATKRYVDNAIAGIGVGGGDIPVGTLMLFAQSSAPTGWTKQTSHNDKMIRVVSGTGGGSGGSDSPILMNKVPVHTHAVNITTNSKGNHNHTLYNAGIGSLNGANHVSVGPNNTHSTAGATSWAGNHTHSVIGDTSNNAGSDWKPLYFDVIIARKN